MLAAHQDQENLAFSHQAGAAAKQQQQNQGFRTLQPKTPGARYPKTPLKIPLNDENATHGLGGKSVLRPKNNNENMTTMGKGGKSSFVTPMEPRTARAPLGNKTTNAKARTGQTAGVKDIVNKLEKTQLKPTTVKPLRQGAVNLEPSKIGVHVDRANPLEEEDIEYAPPTQKDIPYESDIIPKDGLTFEGLKPENILKGYYDHYFNPVDENGVPIREREMEERRQRDFKKLDEQVRKDMEEFDWSIGDVPETKVVKQSKPLATVPENAGQGTFRANKKIVNRSGLTKQPPTIAARKAASALALAPKPTNAMVNARPLSNKPASTIFNRLNQKAQRPAATRESSTDRATAVAASRSTLGYSKGRSTSTAIQGTSRPMTPAGPLGPARRTLTRSVSTASAGSDCTITPARYAQVSRNENSDVLKRLDLLSIFDGDEEDDGNLGGTGPALSDGADDDFQLNLQF
ncbi:hypothetical protein GE09DRAFT_961038 [Coniochaeta sp. 2T2.1]|nr:hypothetical protein GE09DRAFT_961038 [Coniochaeta sp. 2T2.1]